MNKQHQGFTIIELVTVIILIGILAVAVVPKFDGTDSYEAYTFRAQLISSLRLTQQRAMQQTNTADGYCHQIVIENSQYGIPDRTNCNTTTFPNGWQPDATGHIVDSRYNVTFGANPNIVNFDAMGRPGGDCSGGCTIDISSNVETVQIVIESEGYVHAKN